MATYTNLRPFRDYDEKDVINLYAVSGTPIDTTYQILATKGTLVSIVGSGFRPDVEPIQMLGGFGSFQVNNFVAQRYGASAFVTPCTSSGSAYTTAVGMTLFDTRELDENLLPLKFYPRKAAEMEAVISGQVTPIVTKGVFLVSGVTTQSSLIQVSGVKTNQPIVAGNPVFVGDNGTFCSTGYNQVGTFLGSTGVEPSGVAPSIALIWLNIYN